MRLNPHVVFNGDCEAAFRFYEQCFGDKILTMLTWAGFADGRTDAAGIN